jgi:threonine/homoserine/homoserine lactone efflux protein
MTTPMITASLPLVVFAIAGLFSPGPNVVMLTASGARFGFRTTIPHLLGVPVGVGIIAAITGTGVGAALETAPNLTLGFKIAASLWILWLAWKTAQAGRTGRTDDRGRPMTFIEAVAFQAINPKIWAITLAASAGFTIGLDAAAEAMRMFAIFAGVNLFVCAFWTAAGHNLRRLLASEKAWRRFMNAMAIAMAATVILIFA